MTEPFIGEVRMTSFSFAPKNWALCNGALLPINQYQALFSILGTTYGGNGMSTFGLPNLQARAPIGWGNGQGVPAVAIGQVGGEAAHTLTIGEIPAHVHGASGSSATANASVPGDGLPGVLGAAAYSQTTADTTLIAGTVGMNAGGAAHNNLQPYQVVNFIIALQGIFPSRN